MFVFDLYRSFEYSEYFWKENFISEAEIEQILKMGEQGEWQNAGVYISHQTQADYGYRQASLCSLPINRQNQWLYEKAGNITAQCNQAKYHFDITGIFEPMALSRYTPGGHFKWHKDQGSGEISIRKLSLVVQLSRPEDYEGGDLEFFGDKEAEPEMRGYGTAIIFPSFVYHRVTPVTSGERISLVCWIAGPPFR